MLILDTVLDAEDVARVQARLAELTFTDGRATAGAAARTVKQNLQARGPEGGLRALEGFVLAALRRHQTFMAAALPRRISRPLFSRYLPGMAYGRHTDDALMGQGLERLRTDLAFTLFLNEGAAAEGGALCIETPLGVQEVRLEAGQAILYQAGSIHQVAPLLRGERLAAVGWVESTVREGAQRDILFSLAQARAACARDGAGPDALLQLDRVHANLLRGWAHA